jgi:hypothetical protein
VVNLDLTRYLQITGDGKITVDTASASWRGGTL